MNTDSLSPEMIERWLWLRSVEWLNFPAFLSQLAVPLLLIIFPWFYVIGGVVLLGIIWCAARYSFVSVQVANIAAIAVTWLKWPIAIGGAAYLFTYEQRAISLLALLWPLLAAFVGIPGKIGIVERRFGIKIGLTPPS